ncbi:hypothetical protein BDB00DRAFT_813618 [Zychaea mexicana]|uniref:uncharacterized protein n=1 Tax=Zychaea mexicana TaxID=64656 RepID=UPI0022FE4A31|nr:uncharacterized protein BDB00DRAFT_813618 [Zychaea mexicana]KAI9495506.1 hypothetical protein BDB00DRAFT_813618 [Zychaea mexicana]
MTVTTRAKAAAASITSTIGYILLAPIMTALLSILGSLAVVTSVLTSSFISIRLVLLAAEFGLGIMLNSTTQLFAWLKDLLRLGRGERRRQKKRFNDDQAFLKLNSIPIPPPPHRTAVKKMYSKSVPTTPDPTRRGCHEFAF